MTTAISPIAWQDVSGSTIQGLNPSSGNDFLARLTSGAGTLVQHSDRASDLLTAYAAGEDIAPHELVMAMEQAKLSLQVAVEIRNRVVDAYQEIVRLQI